VSPKAALHQQFRARRHVPGLLGPEQIDSGDRVVKVFCKAFERALSSDRREFELALAG
jgi:hypothetical protein